MRKRLAFSFCCAFLFSFCARGCLPPAPAIAQDTTKQTGAFSLPSTIFSGRGMAIVLLMSKRTIADAIFVRVLNVMLMFCASRRNAPFSATCSYLSATALLE